MVLIPFPLGLTHSKCSPMSVLRSHLQALGKAHVFSQQQHEDQGAWKGLLG
jgi:hypothetical protein